jgi:hypothetical protein
MPQADELDKNDFTPGKDYKFDPPLSTLGFPIGVIRGEPKKLSFAEGRCVTFNTERQVYVFRGMPVGNDQGVTEKEEKKYFFHIEIGGTESNAMLLEK